LIICYNWINTCSKVQTVTNRHLDADAAPVKQRTKYKITVIYIRPEIWPF
jgi:hypothetical protein